MAQHTVEEPKVIVSFRGTKIETTLTRETSVASLKAALVEQSRQDEDATASSHSITVLTPSDLKLLWKGKVLTDGDEGDAASISLYDRLTGRSGSTAASQKLKKVYRIVASGVSLAEKQALDTSLQTGMRQSAWQVRDDLTDAGKRRTVERQRLGRQMLQQAQQKQTTNSGSASEQYGFGHIEVLPNLPEQERARAILTELANDPGVLACMRKHQWKVGSLAELYPEGKVGESAVCVMGLNKNKGQQILLRIRTDDLQGFRKPLTIRKVLYHELAHNVYGEHDGKFFQLMRQIEQECNELDWTRGAGLSSTSTEDASDAIRPYSGGTYQLGGGVGSDSETTSTTGNSRLSKRELAARAAMSRMTAEEKEIEQNCGCGRGDLFLPKSMHTTGDDDPDEKKDRMDTSD